MARMGRRRPNRSTWGAASRGLGGLAAAVVQLTTACGALSAPHPPTPPPPPRAPPLVVTTFYEGSLYLKVLDVRADHIVDGDTYRSGARIESIGVVKMVKPVNLLAQAQGRMVQGYPSPSLFTVRSGGKHRSVIMTNLRAADALTQVLRLGLRRGASPCAGPLPVYDGKQSFVLTFAPAGGGDLTAAQRGFGLTSPARCRLSFQPVRGFKTSVSGALHGDSFATFARSQSTGFWVLSEITVGTVAGNARILLTGLKAAGQVPFAQAPPAPSRPRPGQGH